MGLPSLASEIAQSGREGKGGPLPHRPNPAFLPLDQSGTAGGAAGWKRAQGEASALLDSSGHMVFIAVALTTGGTVAEGSTCVFPFVYNGVEYNTCTTVDNGSTDWCALEAEYVDQWGNCVCDGSNADDTYTSMVADYSWVDIESSGIEITLDHCRFLNCSTRLALSSSERARGASSPRLSPGYS